MAWMNLEVSAEETRQTEKAFEFGKKKTSGFTFYTTFSSGSRMDDVAFLPRLP